MTKLFLTMISIRITLTQKKGYIYGNLVIVSDIVNRVKSDVSSELLEKI